MNLREEIFNKIHKFRFEEACTVTELTDKILMTVKSEMDEIILYHDKGVDMTLIRKFKELLK